MQRQIGLMAAVMAAQGTIDPGGKVPEEFLGQAIKEVVMHEVGHTLGLRHNFKSSTFISLKDANNPEITRKKGMTGSVMDYAAGQLRPQGSEARRLLFGHDRPLRLLGDRVRLQADQG